MTLEQTNKLIELFQLKTKRDGFYHTAWGKKTLEGVRASVERIIAGEKPNCDCVSCEGKYPVV